MICGKKINIHGNELPCGRCMPCRINKKRMWTGRILLENKESRNSSTFLTLTYDDEHLPKDKSLQPKDLIDYINRLRHSSLGGFRYFAVGEYGDKTARPHYHMAIFNAPAHIWAERMDKAWKKGYTKAGDIEPGSAAYIAGYCTKKMTTKDDPRLEGRYPEFSRMSKKPPLGAAGVRRIADILTGKHGSAMLEKYRDVPSSYRIDGKLYPIGRYWKNHLREWVGCNNIEPSGDGWDVPINGYQSKADKFAEEKQAQKVADKLWRQQRKTTTRKL